MPVYRTTSLTRATRRHTRLVTTPPGAAGPFIPACLPAACLHAACRVRRYLSAAGSRATALPSRALQRLPACLSQRAFLPGASAAARRYARGLPRAVERLPRRLRHARRAAPCCCVGANSSTPNQHPITFCSCLCPINMPTLWCKLCTTSTGRCYSRGDAFYSLPAERFALLRGRCQQIVARLYGGVSNSLLTCKTAYRALWTVNKCSSGHPLCVWDAFVPSGTARQNLHDRHVGANASVTSVIATILTNIARGSALYCVLELFSLRLPASGIAVGNHLSRVGTTSLLLQVSLPWLSVT